MRRAGSHHAVKSLFFGIVLAIVTLTGLAIRQQFVNQKRENYADGLVQYLLKEKDSSKVPALISEMSAYRQWTDAPLRQANETAKPGTPQKLHIALALLSVDPKQKDYLFTQLLEAPTSQLAILVNALASFKNDLFDKLQDELNKKPELDANEDAKEKLAIGQANAAVTLLAMNHQEKVWPTLRHSRDPRVRSYLIHRLGVLSGKAGILVDRLDEEPDVSAKRALILSLGEFGDTAWSSDKKTELIRKMQQIYQVADDAGLHAAAEWLLRSWEQDSWLKQVVGEWAKDNIKKEAKIKSIRKQLASRGAPAPGSLTAAQWYVTGQGQTMVVIPGAAEFIIGSPTTEVGRASSRNGKDEEGKKKKKMDRPFAIAAREVTLGQFLNYDPTFKNYNKDYSPTLECPVNSISWYVAAAYCNWLSEKEEIPKDQWCYLPNEKGKYDEGMKLDPRYLELTGYRLPTEAEWEYACRAETDTSRFFGESEELLGKYAWYAKNSMDRCMLPGEPGRLGVPGDTLKPNDFGLFDMLGNALEWCQGKASLSYSEGDYEDGGEIIQNAGKNKKNTTRVMRGGSLFEWGNVIRSANRGAQAPNFGTKNFGFRVARTILPEKSKDTEGK
jgi:formylglycine-generating enzyme required for sulfatase activity